MGYYFKEQVLTSDQNYQSYHLSGPPT